VTGGLWEQLTIYDIPGNGSSMVQGASIEVRPDILTCDALKLVKAQMVQRCSIHKILELF
ncbi:hypothetical protein MKW98_024729, partial [Papaver atlanticum]